MLWLTRIRAWTSSRERTTTSTRLSCCGATFQTVTDAACAAIIFCPGAGAARSRSNSQTQLPGYFLLADVDGDGLNDFVAYWPVGSPQLATGSTSFPFRPYTQVDFNGVAGWTYTSIDKIWAGRFADPRKESICFRAKVGKAWYPQNIYCFQQENIGLWT